MINKKEKILKISLDYFAHQGYDATSTARIAKRARVSEGLIFKHYKSKKLLLTSVIEKMKLDIKKEIADIIMDADPLSMIKNTIEYGQKLNEQQITAWTLLMKLRLDHNINEGFYKPALLTALTESFKQLKYKNPGIEAQLLLHTMDGLIICTLEDKCKNISSIINLLIHKYKK